MIPALTYAATMARHDEARWWVDAWHRRRASARAMAAITAQADAVAAELTTFAATADATAGAMAGLTIEWDLADLWENA